MIGLDLVRVDRIARFREKYGEAGLSRFLNPDEIARAKSVQSLAGLWAAKEAVSKALGCGIGSKLGFHDITIIKNEAGAPEAVLSDKAATLHGVKKLAISITHEKEFAAAVAIRL